MSKCLELPDIENFHNLRNKHPNNPFIRYLNINSLRNKVIDLRIIVKDLGLNCFVVSKTKLDESFPLQQFGTEDFEIRARKTMERYGGVKTCHERFHLQKSKLFRT